MKTIVFNKKKSISVSLIIPLFISIILIFMYGLIPEFDESYQQFFKSTLSLVPIFALILSICFYWGSVFLSKPKFEKKEIVVERNRNVIFLLIMPIIVCVLLCIFMSLLPTNPELEFDYVEYGLMSIKITIVISCFIAFIESLLILFCGIKRSVKSGR